MKYTGMMNSIYLVTTRTFVNTACQRNLSVKFSLRLPRNGQLIQRSLSTIFAANRRVPFIHRQTKPRGRRTLSGDAGTSRRGGDLDTSSTIYALSSGQGRCGVAVIRVSGPQAGDALKTLGNFHDLPKPRTAVLRALRHPNTGQTLDKGIVMWFPGPHSFTGEDSCELQVHGGLAVVTAVLDALHSLPLLVPAEPGDFTKRAFSHGRLDLTEVEGLADLIHAETEAQRCQALRQMDGDLSRVYQDWRQRLVKCAANLAAFIDFSEDELIEDEVLDQVTHSVRALRGEMERHLVDGRRGERLREGVHVAIIGEPNVGKSSILNALCRRPAAIVSPSAGTTRDVVETAVNLAGYPVLLSDTAGLRDTSDLVEQEGVRRARQRAQNADIRVVVLDAQLLLSLHGDRRILLETFLQHHLLALGLTSHIRDDSYVWDDATPRQSLEEGPSGGVNLLDRDESLLVVVNKCDLVDVGTLRKAVHSERLPWAALSCLTQQGMEDFLDQLTHKVKELCGNPAAGNPSLTQARHRNHLTACIHALDSFLEQQNNDLVVAGEYARQAVYQMGKLTGKITSDEVLDVVFRDFCIGK